MTPDTPSPWPDRRPPLQADDDSPDLSSPEGIERIRCLVARAIGLGIITRPAPETPASAATDGIADTVEHGEGQATPPRWGRSKGKSDQPNDRLPSLFQTLPES